MLKIKIVVFAVTLGCMPIVLASAALADWMAYSVDGRGKFGHSRAPSRASARQAALNFCGRPGCYVIAVTKARCTALAVSNHRGYWVGMGSASSKAGAMGYAISWCSKNVPASTCRVTHTYCK